MHDILRAPSGTAVQTELPKPPIPDGIAYPVIAGVVRMNRAILDFYRILHRSTGTRAAAYPQRKRGQFVRKFEQAGPVELVRWAQSAVDTGDPVVADAA